MVWMLVMIWLVQTKMLLEQANLLNKKMSLMKCRRNLINLRTFDEFLQHGNE
jgi:hypothetical protein